MPKQASSFSLVLTLSTALLAPSLAFAQSNASNQPVLMAQGGLSGTLPTELPPVSVTASRLGEGITGTSTTVISYEEIQRSPGDTIQEVLSRQAGIQTRSLYGGVGGAGTTVDMRGFGATASANTLVLVNGRRLNDIDLAGIDFAAIPKDSIERIEVIRGNSGSVLYGDGAVGGVINIITSGAMRPGFTVEGGIGTLGRREMGASARQSVGGFEMAAYGNFVNSDGYRDNNKLLQRNANGEIRKHMEFGDLYMNFSVDDQQLGLPGERSSRRNNQHPRGAMNPYDYANKQGQNLTIGGTYLIGDAADLIIDAGVRRKSQDAYFDQSGFPSYVDTELTTYSFTPRLNLSNKTFGLDLKSTIGVDIYRSDYESDRQQRAGNRPINRYAADQESHALYGQSTLGLTAATDISAGLRLQRTEVSARDRYDATAPGGGFGAQGSPFDDSETNHAYHVGFEHRFDPALAVFARTGRSFRFPTLDERIGMGSPTSFVLRTQTSRDAELGIQGRAGDAGYRLSGYVMQLENELAFNAVAFTNRNLDPTERRGVEASGDYTLLPDVKLRGALSYTNAEFREGTNAGKTVPLVSTWSGNIGVSWDILPKLLLLDVDARFFSDRRMENDDRNFQPQIPGTVLVDLRLSGRLEDRLRWSLAVQNLFDKNYYDYSVASATTFGAYNYYPQPGRTAMARVSLDF
ncbi:TonB-dependent receptor [Ferrovibrio sp.]|uniref:TonB-dependent receptor n=1 Tax=Ferrovibrio sp. TaxID=1917215 RepID=UPI003D10DCC1